MSDDVVSRLRAEHSFRIVDADDGERSLVMMTEAERREEAALEIERLRAALPNPENLRRAAEATRNLVHQNRARNDWGSWVSAHLVQAAKRIEEATDG